MRVVGNGELAHGAAAPRLRDDSVGVEPRVLPYLTCDHRVVLYDLVRAGSVNLRHFDFRHYDTLDSYIDDLLAILNALRIPRCTFVGHSVSVMIGILVSIRQPELFAKLILTSSPEATNAV